MEVQTFRLGVKGSGGVMFHGKALRMTLEDEDMIVSFIYYDRVLLERLI